MPLSIAGSVVAPVQIIEQFTAPAGEVITAGQATVSRPGSQPEARPAVSHRPHQTIASPK